MASASWEGASGTPLTIPQSSGCECSPTFFAGLANVQHAASVKSKVLVYMLVPPNSQLAECNVNLIQLFSVVSQYCLSVFSIQAHDTKSFLRLCFTKVLRLLECHSSRSLFETASCFCCLLAISSIYAQRTRLPPVSPVIAATVLGMAFLSSYLECFSDYYIAVSRLFPGDSGQS